MVKKTQTLNMLIDLARTDMDDAARRLAQLVEARRGAEQQLEALHSYRKDYAERLLQETKTGLTASNYHNFRQFIATLDDAISQQNTILEQMDAKLRTGQESWKAEKRRLSSFETLQTRQLRQEAVHESRREQRMNDEISARGFRGLGL
ncbi:MAG TPA: flagellar export protein FliJ [Pusillimonas sp.]|uniref:flagellar export protein FliJ n=1 Tax=Pusillimonas sp. TaxID=3040095 RepID=UPI002C12582F|nr:flagellar export protein FliJ [Pusillimonas sp.]HUH88905.1 flagellar export protein FliJ [Pusillimonas sp.]